MNTKDIAYWATSGLLALAMAGSSAGYLTGAMDENMQQIGLPAWFVLVLGTWKGLGAIALVAPVFPRIKEWAYAGFGFTFTGAVVAHLGSGDPIGTAIPPLVMLGLLVASYVLRPARLTLVPAA